MLRPPLRDKATPKVAIMLGLLLLMCRQPRRVRPNPRPANRRLSPRGPGRSEFQIGHRPRYSKASKANRKPKSCSILPREW
jgi:hypothetical protein